MSESKREAIVPVAFDVAALERHTMGDLQLQREVLGLFSAQLQSLNARLAEEQIPAAEAKFLAHSLRGAAASVGALRIQDLAEKWQENPGTTNSLKAELALTSAEFLAASGQKTL